MNLDIDLSQIIIGILNFFVLYFILKKVLFKPFIRIIEERKEKINKSIEENEKRKTELEGLKEEYNTALKEQESMKKSIIIDYKNKAQKEYNYIMEKAKQDGEKIEDNARQKAEQIKNRAITEAKNDIANISIQIASKIAENNINQNINNDLVEKFIKKEVSSNE